MTSSKRVVITGMGAVTPIGETPQECWQNIMEQRHGFRKVDFDNSYIHARFFGFLPESAIARQTRYQLLPKSLCRALSTCGQTALEAARQAIEQAFGQQAPVEQHYDPFECGVIMGSGWGGMDHCVDFIEQYRQQNLAHPMSNLITMPSAMTAACSIKFGFKGIQQTLMAACATGSMAIGEAFEAIRAGRAKCMLAGGSESLTSAFSVWSIDVLNALSREQKEIDKACCPFSAERSGFVLSEGAAVICLEDYDSAVNRNATILGEITGYAQFSDADTFTRPSADINARVRAIESALKQAGITANAIDYVNAHGTSTPLNDRHETRALKAALGEQAYRVPISSTKSYTGHLIAAAGSFETIVCIQAMQHGCLPATLNLHTPDPDCDLNYLPDGHLQQVSARQVLNISAGFGGHNTALVLTDGTQ